MKAGREKEHTAYGGTTIWEMANFLSETTAVKRQWNDIFKCCIKKQK